MARKRRRRSNLGKQPRTKAGKPFNFNRLVRQLKSRGATNPEALAAWIARRRSS